MSRTIFLDRDDTIVPETPYLDHVEGIELLEGSGEALRRMQDLGYQLALVTNQSGIGRGYFPESMVHAQHARLAELLDAYGVRFETIRFCPHTPGDHCGCRKPEPGMLIDAGRELGTDFSRSWMIGNCETDVAAGKAAGCRSIQIVEGVDLTRAAQLIEEADRKAAG